MKKILFLNREDIKGLITMKEMICAMKDAFSLLSSGKAKVPLRTSIEMEETNGVGLFMPVYLPSSKKIGLKVVTVFKDNPQKGLPMIHALILVLSTETGEPVAVMDGEFLTAMRTGAASGLATDLLSRKNSSVAAVIGTGIQGFTQLQAVCSVRPVRRAILFDSDKERAEFFAAQAAEILALDCEVISDTAGIREADIICTSTSSLHPVFRDSDLKPGVHINGIGSYRPDMAEIPPETVQRAKVVADEKRAVLSEAGDIIQPIKSGLFIAEHIFAELGEIVLGLKAGRENNKEITFFKSVGNAVQDLAAAALIISKAERSGIGQKLTL